MKIATSLFFLGLLSAIVVGCGSEEIRTSTEGADARAIAEYEAAVEAAQGSMSTSEEATAEVP